MGNRIKLACMAIAIALSGLLLPLPAFAQSISAQSTFAQSFSAPQPMAFLSFSGTRPVTLGVQNGQLGGCPNSPNCVSSQAPASDSEHSIAPIPYTGTTQEAIAKLKSVIQAQERTQIIEATDNYLYAEFSSKLLGFVDDVEFYADDSAKVIQVRSASRLGQSDLGVNRKRVEEIRSLFA
ncbi:MAG: DUF1499 domain-containing protein [Thermosynechococcaceae cyanobacterium MS004]|nr:DUF1499 domain-containing protein [Thermosynechococcaceae cyanobacterium MS004]